MHPSNLQKRRICDHYILNALTKSVGRFDYPLKLTKSL